MRPIRPAGRPPPSFVHFRPPSVVFQMPLPGPPMSRSHGMRVSSYVAA